jgi:hypothetical protein
MSKINLRSPYHIYITDTNLTSAKLELYIYTGTQTSSRGSVIYTLNSTAYNDKITFEISELVRDYLDITFDGNYTSQMIWVDYQITRYISEVAQTPETIVQLNAFDGYGYFEDGANPQNESDILISNNLIYKLDNTLLHLPIEANENKTVYFYENDVELHSKDITASTNSTSRIVYVANEIINENDYINRVQADGGTFEGSTCLTEFIDSLFLNLVDKIIVGNSTYTIENVEECFHTPYKLTFVNKFGVLQDLWFFKRANKTLNVNSETYKSNIINNGTYSISEHQNKILNKQGNEKLSLNSGFVNEQYNEVFKQLMLSEKVWIDIENQTIPIEISSTSLSYKNRLNDKLINYTIELNFAFETINNIR